MYKAQKVQKYALNSQLQALQILTNDDEVENWSLSSFLLAVLIIQWDEILYEGAFLQLSTCELRYSFNFCYNLEANLW